MGVDAAGSKDRVGKLRAMSAEERESTIREATLDDLWWLAAEEWALGGQLHTKKSVSYLKICMEREHSVAAKVSLPQRYNATLTLL